MPRAPDEETLCFATEASSGSPAYRYKTEQGMLSYRRARWDVAGRDYRVWRNRWKFPVIHTRSIADWRAEKHTTLHAQLGDCYPNTTTQASWVANFSGHRRSLQEAWLGKCRLFQPRRAGFLFDSLRAKKGWCYVAWSARGRRMKTAMHRYTIASEPRTSDADYATIPHQIRPPRYWRKPST